MQEVKIVMQKLTKDEAKNVPDGTQLLWYNSKTGNKGIDTAGKGCLARYKNCADSVEFYAFDASEVSKRAAVENALIEDLKEAVIEARAKAIDEFILAICQETPYEIKTDCYLIKSTMLANIAQELRRRTGYENNKN